MTLPAPLIEIVTALRPPAVSLTPTSTLDEIGFDSLDRVRLAAALESAYGVVIPDAVLAEVHRLGDLTAVLGTHPPAESQSQIVPDRIPAPREAPRPLPPAVVHPSAELGEAAHVGLGSRVWHRAQLADGVEVGEECTLGTGVHLGTGTRVGNRVKMQNLVQVFGADIHDDVMLAPAVLILEDPAPRAVTPAGAPQTPADWTARPVTVCRGATIGAGAVLLPGVRIGAHALVAAGAVVDHDVPPHALLAGNPCRQIGWACLCGHRLTNDTCRHCGTRYQRGAHSM
ncbi:phosphopantetheine-binding protein [Amycolatopsis sp. A133]|uniref:phosphopantetheine-binding protein n=1 Tax=Amycolatopsis sp. A133 TaxID=3064472 RepID=UPI0027EC8BE4|nr:phosphopantetheine-binding protein [Amycolatopsis sp. A133]MDQ7808424.1 phosphopantetheine-binding protein [Amycolatopsis sp. A133]